MDKREERVRKFGDAITRLTRGQHLTRAETRECWRQICAEEQSELHQGAFLAALRVQSANTDEVVGTFETLYEFDTNRVEVHTPEPLIDNCGTGADTLKTLNISTGAAIVAAACGVYVVRHAARAVSSNCGAIDVIEALGVNVDSAPELPKQSIEHAGIGAWNAFLPAVHPKTLPRILPQIRFGTIINLVGPLLNPSMPAYKVMGVPSREMVDLEARTLRELGIQRGFVMYGLEEGGDGGMDELSTLGLSHVAELWPDGSIEHSVVSPEDLNLPRGRLEEIASSNDIERDAIALLRVVLGSDVGPRSDIICLNAAPILYLMGKAKSLGDGIAVARQAIQSGNAAKKLRAWVTWQNANPNDGLVKLDRMIRKAA